MTHSRFISPFILLLCALFIGGIVGSSVTAQQAGTWVEYINNPIFGQFVGGPRAYYPSVLYDAGSFSAHDNGWTSMYKLWYGTSGGQTGLATSDDGLVWTDRGVVNMPVSGYHATVEYYPAGFVGNNFGANPSGATMYYRMWYWRSAALYSIGAIRYAESDNGYDWYNDQPVQNGVVPIITGVNPDWNRGSYGPCDILYNPGAPNTGTDWVFTMYYDGTTGGDQSIGLAFSADGITWTGYDADGNTFADPVLTGTGIVGDWDADYVSRATIIRNSPTNYEMWYSGGLLSMDDGIGYATSTDGINWTRHAGNPIFHFTDTGYPGFDWRSDRSYCPMVVLIGGEYVMWYAGRSPGGQYTIGVTHAVPPVPAPPPQAPPPAPTDTPAPVIQLDDPFITKSADPPFTLPGETVTFTFTITNPNDTAMNNVRAVDTIPGELEIISATTSHGTVTVSGQDVIVEIPSLGPHETAAVTIETRVRDDVGTPFAILNEACITSPALLCAQAGVISVEELPVTGESPWSRWRLPILMLILAGLSLAVGYLGAALRRRDGQGKRLA